MLNLTIIDDTTATTTVTNWNLSTVGSIGYKQDGSIGYTGGSARRAYVVTTSSSPPAVSPTTVSGDTRPTNTPSGVYAGGSWTGNTWQSTPYEVPAGTYYMWIVDGVYNVSTDQTIWSSGAYQASLKVGNLQAITTETGQLTISTSGNLKTTGKTYGSATAGIFIGYDTSAYKVDIGSSTKYLRWTGSALQIVGDISGASNLDITGYAKIEGNASYTVQNPAGTGTLSRTAAAVINTSNNAQIALYGSTSSNNSFAIQGYGSAATGGGGGVSGAGFYGVLARTQSASGYGLFAQVDTVAGSAATAIGAQGNNGNASSIAIHAINTLGLALKVEGTSSFTVGTATFGTQTAFTYNSGAPFTVVNTTKVTNLNADLLDGTDWRAPGPIGGTTPSTGAFTSITVTSTSQVTNLNASLLLGNTWASPGTIGGTTPAAITTTGLTVTTNGITINNASPGITFYESDRDFNLKRWLLVADGELFQLQTRTDADAQTNTPLIINRSGNMEVLGQVQSGSLRIQQTPTTGAHAANNSTGGAALVSKPGSAASNNTWMSLILNGTTYYIPVWT